MAVRQKAIGVAWAITSTAFAAGTGAGTALKIKPTGESYKKLADSVETKDKNGEVNGKVYFNQREELTLRVYPSDATIAGAKGAGGTMGLAIGDRFTITDADDPDIAGSYLVEDVSKERVIDNIVTFEVMLRAYAADITEDTA